MSGHHVHVERSAASPRHARARSEARSERTRMLLVAGLTLSCTAMALLDLFLLASGG